MRFALVDNNLSTPKRGMTGICRVCGSSVISKCGTIRVHHWAHRGERNCDTWHEPRTRWHYEWQDRFPKPWQEFVRFASSGEKHIADVYTDQALTVEFQYSHLNPEERVAREAFYGNMVWVVSGSRLVRDLPRFVDGKRFFVPVWKNGVFLVPHPERAFPRNWCSSAVPVFFDFVETPSLSDLEKLTSKVLWCLLPGRVFGSAVVIAVSRDQFVQLAHEREHPIGTSYIRLSVAQTLIDAQRARDAQIARQRSAEMAKLMRRNRRPWKPRGKFRRF